MPLLPTPPLLLMMLSWACAPPKRYGNGVWWERGVSADMHVRPNIVNKLESNQLDSKGNCNCRTKETSPLIGRVQCFSQVKAFPPLSLSDISNLRRSCPLLWDLDCLLGLLWYALMCSYISRSSHFDVQLLLGNGWWVCILMVTQPLTNIPSMGNP